ncbi:unnamed protein product [Bursaphelenchus xylophilus]|uniref:carnosine N-methyltransferase n=1 Tax=Bursaphelenchus xylophilus TaxID=6326 RepID=A0A7I8WNX7_BURXY|nr:unnamed protein product [Bursaphelenchus xylophilus]CAG9094291.1 unnamed protein product [Bursaphelenchus xylophilus]
MNGECSKEPENDVEAEVEVISEVLSAMLYYERHAAAKFRRQAKALKSLDDADRKALTPTLSSHFREALRCAAENQKFLDQIINCGRVIFDDNSNYIKAMDGLNHGKVPSEHYMSKARSTLRQIVRDWSEEGRPERESCYNRVLEAMREIYPEKHERYDVKSLVCGSGLARLNWELLKDGFSVTGNEFSYFMILASNFMLNACKEKEQFTIYPYLLDFSNCWSYSDALRPVKIPDIDPSSQLDNTSRPNSFSMCAGDFVTAFEGYEQIFDTVITVFFIDTAVNPFKYIQTIKRLLKPGGRWINFGPLTYHFEDSEEDSIELPFDLLLEQIKRPAYLLPWRRKKMRK